MKSKAVTVLLSFISGNTGAQRFYLGQRKKGQALLLVFWLITPGAIYGCKEFLSSYTWDHIRILTFVLWYGGLIITNLIEGFTFAFMKKEQFEKQDISRGNTLPLTFVAILFAMIFGTGFTRLIARSTNIDITKANAEITITSQEMSKEFRANETDFRKKYDNKVLQIDGKVIETGEDFEKGSYFALEGESQDMFGIKCFFVAENAGDAKDVQTGDTITIKGVCDGNTLQNAKVISINKK